MYGEVILTRDVTEHDIRTYHANLRSDANVI